MQRGNNWVKYFWLVLVVYMSYSVGKVAYKNHLLNVEEMKLREEILVMENDIQDLKNKIIYYQSDSYKEKMLRARLNLQKEGEKVVVIEPEPDAEIIAEPQKKLKKTNPEKWWDYFVGI